MGVPLVKDDEGCIKFDYATNLVGENLLHDQRKVVLGNGRCKVGGCGHPWYYVRTENK
jgi:hypothetical protein